jgi:signal transduction histidine kinase
MCAIEDQGSGHRSAQSQQAGRTPFVESNLELASVLSGQAAIAIEKVKPFENLEQAKAKLEKWSRELKMRVIERTKELDEAQERLIRMERLAILGQMASRVGHELRNPLAAIKNAAYFLNMVLEEPDPKVKEMLEILEEKVNTCERIISSLLDFGRTKPPAWRKADINEIVQEALARISVPENVEVVSQLDKVLPIIQADPSQLGQAFGNIILNAIQAMPEGGRLVVKTSANPSTPLRTYSDFSEPLGLSASTEASTVSPLARSGFVPRLSPRGRGSAEPLAEVSEQMLSRAVEQSEAPSGEWVAISFTDTGVGIPKENLGKLFEPLFTTKAKGIGLGLAISKQLIEAHEGTIEVESQIGKGTTFRVRLPISVG